MSRAMLFNIVLLAPLLGCAPGSVGADASLLAENNTDLPGFGERCAPIEKQGDPACAEGLACIVYGPSQGQGHMCTAICSSGAGGACGAAPADVGAVCGRNWQVSGGTGGVAGDPVCEIPCDPNAPNCPSTSRCVVDPLGTTAHYCVPDHE